MRPIEAGCFNTVAKLGPPSRVACRSSNSHRGHREPASASTNRQGTRSGANPSSPLMAFLPAGSSRMNTFIGLDVCREFLDLHVRPTGQVGRFPTTPAGHRQLLAALPAPEAVGRIVLEATGGLEAPVAAALAAAGYPVAVVNPRQVRDFAKAAGQLAKTDALDAAILAHFGEALKPDARPLPSAELQEFRELLDRREQLLQMRTAESNRHDATTQKAVRKDIEAHLAWLD